MYIVQRFIYNSNFILVGYHGFCKVENIKEKKLSLNLIEDFCRGTTLDLYITGTLDMIDIDRQLIQSFWALLIA